MTIGARIAQKRKELGLSQEALGEQLCVSRQAIYKWEADATLPEIEKLVALSKLFGVPVGWLLGVEEEAEVPKEDDELTEAQLKMVEEIVARYLAAQPKPKPRRRWPWVLAAAVVLVVGIHLFSRLDQLNSQYNNLQNAVGNLNWSVNDQIGGIAGRVEEILKAQNNLTADYGTQILRADLSAGTVTFALRAVPKTFVDGLEAVFLANSGTGPVEFPATLSDGGVFSAEAAVEMTDSITLSVVFINPDGTRQTQLLDTYEALLSDSLPWVNLNSDLYWREVEDGVLTFGKDEYATALAGEGKTMGASRITVDDIRVGVFVNQKLVAWAEESDQPTTYHGDWGNNRFFRLPEVTVTLGESDRLQIAALVTDNFGRQFMACDIPYVVEYDEKGAGELRHPGDAHYDRDPDIWVLEAGEVWPTTTAKG